MCCCGICGNNKSITINTRLVTSKEAELCTLAEEIGHLKTNSALPVDAYTDLTYFKSLILKNEQRATSFAARKIAPASRIKQAIKKGFKSVREIAIFCGVTEEFMAKVLAYYEGQQVGFLGGGGRLLDFEIAFIFEPI